VKMRIIFLVAVMLLPASCPTSVFGKSWPKGKENSPCIPLGGVSLEGLGLTDEQRAAVERIEKERDTRVRLLREKLMIKRLELQSVFRDHRADEETIRDRVREVCALQDAWRHIVVDCRIQIRRVLTPDQLRKWCSQTDGCFPWDRGK